MEKNMKTQWKHRVLTLVLALLLLVQAVPFGAVRANAAEVTGQIETAATGEVVKVSDPQQLTYGVPAGSTYELTCDITLGAGDMIPEVEGVLDGKGHTITLNGRPLSNEVTGTIQNLIVTSSGPVGCRTNTGTIAAKLTGGKLYNCLSLADIYGGIESQMGGLVYCAERGAEIRNCIFAGKFTSHVDAGLVRDALDVNTPANPSTFANCFYNDDGGKVRKPIGLGKQGRDYKVEFLLEAKTVDAMKTADFVDLLNKQNLGTGYIWQAVEGNFPKLVAGGEIIEHANLEKLNAAIKEAASKVKTDYTSDSWEALQVALEKARQTAGKFGVSQQEVDDATAALNEALAALQEKVREHFPVELPKEDIIPISSAADFKKIPSDNAGKVYQLTQDIEIEGGFLSHNLSGVFDGGGHTITLMTEMYSGSSLFNQILPTGIVQNLNVKVEGSYPNYHEFAPYAQELKGGMIVNCVSHVTGQHSTGFVMYMMDGGIISNCLTMGHNRRGAFVHYQKSTDHRNTNGYSGGKLYNCYWAPSNSVENIEWIAPENLIACRPAGDDELRSDGFMRLLNSNKGEHGATWGRDAEGYPYLGKDLGDRIIDGSKNLYPVEFVSYNNEVQTVKEGRLEISPQMVASNGRFAGTLQLKGVPEDSTITWSSEDRANREVIALYDNNRMHVYFDGGAVLTATERKADGTEQLAAEIRVVSESHKIEELRLMLDGKVVDKEIVVQGSEDKTLDIQAKYEGSPDFRSLPPYLAKMQPEKEDHLFTSYNSSTFHCKTPGSSNLTVTTKNGDVSVTVKVTSEYVPVKSITPGINGTQKIHGRNSMGSGEFNDIPVTVSVEPVNASYKDNYTVESGDPSIAVFGSRKAYVPFKAGSVTFTAKIDDNGKSLEGTSDVTFVYENPLVKVSMPSENIDAEVGKKQTLDLKFEGKDSTYAAVSEPELVWSYSQTGIVSISRPNPLMQLRDTNTVDVGNWVASTQYELKALKPGTVTVTGTPVDTSENAQPVTFTVTVTGDESNIPVFDIPKFIAEGKEAATKYLLEKTTYTFGQEWNIYALLRDGQELPQEKLDSYYNSVVSTVKSWEPDIRATEIERTALALSIMDKDITNVDGVNLASMIYNHPNLPRQGSNALIWGLIALDLKNTPVPDDATWTRERMVTELLTYQKENGSFGLDQGSGSSLDITAMALQALACYQEMDGVQEAVEQGIAYMAKAAEKNLNYGSSESISQVIIALSVLNRDLVKEPGFGDQADNLMSVLSMYLVKDQGFEHADGQGVNSMATVQSMQALCAYERFLNGESSYWDLLGTRPIFDPVAKVIKMIDRLPEHITLDDAEAVRAARKAFDALNPEQQERVTNVAKLEAAEEAIRNMSQDEQAALEVVALIDAIGEVTLESQDKIDAARTAYDALTEEQKKLVSNYTVLEKAEETLAKLKEEADNQAPVKEVEALIDEIGEVTLESQSKIEAARAAYDALTEEQKKLVSNYAALEKAEEALAKLKEEADNQAPVKEVEALIDEIGEVTLESKDKIEAARAAYDALTEEQKKLVNNYNVLQEAEESLRIWQLPKVDAANAYQATGDRLEKLANETAPIVNSIGGEWLVLGLVRSGRAEPAGYYQNVLDYVNQKINDKEQLHRNKSTDNSRVILALTAIGKDVTDVAGHNLLQGLTDMNYLKKQGINGPIWALIAFDSHNYEIPTVYEGGEQVTRESLIEVILAGQLSDGGWALSGTESDPDMTAMALQALAPYYKGNDKVKTAVDKALDTLSKIQMPDGHFGSWGTVNSESSSQIIVALTSLGINPTTDPRFVKNGRSVVDALCDFYVEDGGFKHIADGEFDGMASEQGYYALTALNRLLNGQTRLFDMTDVTLRKALPFTDVPQNQWYYNYVEYVYNHDLMNGISDTTFAPAHKMTRGQLVTVLYRMAGSPEVEGTTSFTDVEKGRYYEDAVIWASKNGITDGLNDTTFGPHKHVTREQMATFFARYAEKNGADMDVSADLTGFADHEQVSNYAEKTMKWAVGTKLIQGVDKNTLRPRGDATRAQVAAMLQRLDLLLKG